MKLTQTKKNNEKMAIVTLEDLDGTLDLLVFPKAYKDYGQILAKDAILFFKGNLDKKEQEPKILVNEITPVHEVHKRFTRSVHVRLLAEGAEENVLKSLQEVLSQYPGNIPVYLEFVGKNNAPSQLLVDRSLFVKPSEDLVSSLQKVLGTEAISLKI